MSSPKSRRATWTILIFVSAVPRILGTFFLPNAFGDAYVYIRDIGVLSTNISSGAFRLTDLFGFWLPLYQFLSALLNVFIKNGFYSGKLVSAVFGVGVCLFVYAITLILTSNYRAALLIFLLVALNPLHIFYSASAMTDVPHAFFVLGSLYFVLRSKWIAAAIFAALAGLTRVESWMFIALIPLIQIIRERRVSVIGLLIMILPPLFWFYISWKTTGDWLACFRQRQQYHDWLLVMNPALAHFSVANVLRDSATLLFSAEVVVLIACFFAGWFVLRRFLNVWKQQQSDEAQLIMGPVVFFFAFFSLLIGAYLTHQQPIIFPRYGLILFSVGAPLLAWAYLEVIKRRGKWSRKLLVSTVLLCFINAAIQTAGVVGELNRYKVQRSVSDYLRDHFDQTLNGRIFCDEGTVRVMSGIPADRFLTSADARRNPEAFMNYLSENKVDYLIIGLQTDDAVSAKRPRWPEYDKPVGPCELVLERHSEFLPTNIRVYRRRPEG